MRAVRQAGYTPQEATSRTWYEERLARIDEEAGRARFVYDLRMDDGQAETTRHILLSLNREEEGRWKVFAFTLKDGSAPSAP